MKDTDAILSAIERVSPFPEVVMKAVALLQDPDVSAAKLLEVIQYDPVITMRLLQVCNSAIFALRRKVDSLKNALFILGNDGMLRLLITFGALEMLKHEMPGYGLRRGELWDHAVACAIMSQTLLRSMDCDEDNALFTGALLHDVGKIVLNEYVGKEYEEIMQEVRSLSHSCLEAEREVIGMDHAQVGSLLAERWQFPETIISIIGRHHEPVHPSRDPLSICLVHLANLLCAQMGIGAGDQGLFNRSAPNLIQSLGWSPRNLDQCISILWTELEKVRDLMDLARTNEA
jgi:putative nucleotidyltransferase with HDIG domain